MALEFATGTLNIGTGAATTTYSVTDKTPASGSWKAVILFWSGRPETTDADGETHIQPGIGVAVAPNMARWAVTGQAEHAQTTTDSDRYHTRAGSVALLDIGGALVALARVLSFNSNGFTVIVDDAFPAALEVGYVLLGGDDITNAEAGMFTASASTGDADYIGTTFLPDFALFAGNLVADPPGGGTNLRLVIGMATATAQAVLAVQSAHGQADSDSASYIYTNEVASVVFGADAMEDRFQFTSFLPDGFRINRLEGTNQYRLHWLALKGGSYKIGNFNTATNTTAFTAAHGMSAAPKGVMFLSANRAQSTQDTPTAHAEWSVGASDGSTNNCQYVRSKDAAASSDEFTAVSHDQCYLNASNDAAQVIEGEGHVNSFDGTNINFQMTDADDAENLVCFVGFGDGVGGGTPYRPPRHIERGIWGW